MNLVVAMAANYGIEQVRNFVCSFKKHQENDVLLVLQNNDRATRDWLHARGVLTIDAAIGVSPEFARYFALHELLEKYPEYTRIFHCDVRDAVAQGDIFAQIPGPGLHVFLEDPSLAIRDNKLNSLWITMTYGEDTLALYASETVICSGTTLGDRDSFLVYTHAMTEEYERGISRKNSSDPLLQGWDQGVHNHLIHTGQLEADLKRVGKQLVRHDNGDGVFTLALAKNFSVSKTYQLLTPKRTVPAVVHQYDRFTFLKEMFDTIYANA